MDKRGVRSRAQVTAQGTAPPRSLSRQPAAVSGSPALSATPSGPFTARSVRDLRDRALKVSVFPVKPSPSVSCGHRAGRHTPRTTLRRVNKSGRTTVFSDN